MPEPYYTTADDLRAELGVAEEVLADPAAVKIIEDAEDLIDALLGSHPLDLDTGRKIVEADVEPARFAKLSRATYKLAALIYQNPGLATDARWRREKGPEFEVEDPIGGAIATAVILPLNQSGLRILTGHARTGRRGRHPFFDRHDSY